MTTAWSGRRGIQKETTTTVKVMMYTIVHLPTTLTPLVVHSETTCPESKRVGRVDTTRSARTTTTTTACCHPKKLIPKTIATTAVAVVAVVVVVVVVVVVLVV